MMKNIAVVCLMFCLTGMSFAQDKIVMLNGNVEEGVITKRTDEMVTYTYEKGKKKKKKTAEIEMYRVFSITPSGGEEEIVYKQDTMMGNFRTVNEMQHFIYGQQDAEENYNATAYGVGTFLVTSGLLIIDAQDPEQEGNFDRQPSLLIVLAAPFAGVMAASLTPVKIRLENVSDPAYLSEESYVEGYVRKVKVKRVMASLKGYLVGVAVGGGTYFILRP